MSSVRPILGLVPAAGGARRLGRLPCSKEIFPIAFELDDEGEPRPSPVCSELLRGLARAGVERALVVLRDGKWDVPSRLGDGSEWGLDLGFLVVEDSRSVPETLGRALGWAAGHDVALGFPDILLRPRDAWSRLLTFHRSHDADVSFALFPTDQSWKADMVELDGRGRVREIVIKDPACNFPWTWSLAVWRPTFTAFLGDFLESSRESRRSDGGATETYIGDVFRAALDRGLDVRGLPFEGGSFLDVGTPEDLRRAVSQGAASEDATRDVHGITT